MLKFNSRRDAFTIILFILGLILSVGVCIGGFFISTSSEDFMSKLLAMILMGVALAFFAALICNLIRTSYTFYEDAFEVAGGFSKKQLSYKQIYALQRSKRIFCLNALAREKFEIIYRGEGPRIFISPENEEVFLKELKKHCKNLQIRDYK